MSASRVVVAVTAAATVALGALAACAASDSGADSTTDASYGGSGGAGGAGPAAKQATTNVGPMGGVVAVDGATLTFAPGALPTMTSITLTATDEAPPSGYVALSKIYRCEPSGLSFPEGVTMTIDFAPDGGAATMLWSSASNPSFTDVGGVASGSRMTATIKHFSSGFVGRGP